MVGKVETSIDPYALLGNFNVFLRVHGPLSLGGNPLSLCFVSGLHGPLAWVKGAYSCALSALHGDVGAAGGALGNHSGLIAVLSGVWRESSGVVSGPWDWRGLEARLSSACQCCIQPNVFIIARGSKAPRCLGTGEAMATREWMPCGQGSVSGGLFLRRDRFSRHQL